MRRIIKDDYLQTVWPAATSLPPVSHILLQTVPPDQLVPYRPAACGGSLQVS
jgi:hypothetical protein